jgi:hypothetical protein
MRLLFVVHGMGVHGQDWAAATIAKLNDVASRYEIRNGRRFDQDVTIVPITYDGEFTRHLEVWDNSSEELQEFAREQQIQLPPGLIDWLRGASETEQNFFWSHVVDVVLYRFFRLVATPARLQLMKQITTKLAAAMQNGVVVQASVLAHSLGTAVTHDALAALGSLPFDGSEAFMVARFRFENIFMVANVGRILETAPRCYESCLHPISRNPAAAYCTRYYNFRHALDPFPAVRPFEPADWGTDLITPAQPLDHLYEFNVHGLEHYLEHPAVHIPFINGMFGRVIDKDVERAAIRDFPRVPPNHPCPQQLIEAETSFRRLVQALRGSDDPLDVVKTGARFFAAAKEARDACR